MDVNGTPKNAPQDAFLEKTVEFPDGSRYERLAPLTDLRKDPGEGRILFTCRRVREDGQADEEEFVMKIKAQWPGPQGIYHPGPSPHTEFELKALQKFTDVGLSNVPHLITWKRGVQGEDGIHPGGYVVFLIITKMPGQTLFDIGYWGLTKDERVEIQRAFMVKLKEIWALGIAPYDCALRNVLWDRETKQASIIDFEHYHDTEGQIDDETKEFQRWGLVQRPPPYTWAVEWLRSH